MEKINQYYNHPYQIKKKGKKEMIEEQKHSAEILVPETAESGKRKNETMYDNLL